MRTVKKWVCCAVSGFPLPGRQTEKRFQFFGQAEDLKHNGNLQSILALANPFVEEIAVC